jgi:2-succinyl-5-enolpyruvyl-6-hydroxy-3-cyclohexene-1-carboxylate synthase
MISSTYLARSTIRSLIESGIDTYVLSPGSRNAPLSIALYEASQKGLIDLHVKIDERGAGFFALGAAKASGKYVAVICTSGTAAANYHPALLEAYHAHNDLLVITADRPARLRKTGANQTTDQVKIFGNIPSHDHAEKFDAAALLTGGPVHINIQFDEPLLPSEQSDWLAGIHVSAKSQLNPKRQTLKVSPTTVIVIGHDLGTYSVEEINAALEGIEHPVIVEDPLSFPYAIGHASVFLADQEIRQALRPDQVIVIGRTTLSRSVNAFINEAPQSIVIDPRMERIDTERSASEKILNLPKFDGDVDGEFLAKWQGAYEIASQIIQDDAQWSERLAIRLICEGLPRESALFIGSSRPVRDVEGFAAPRSGISVFANRGLAGIDGNISTAFGISGNFAQTFAILGDITFQHDLGALISQPTNSTTIFVIDNNGGGIFSTLPQAGVDGFEIIFGTPQNTNLEKLVTGFGISVTKVKTKSDIERVLARVQPGLQVVIVEVPSRDEMAKSVKEVYQSVSSAVRMGEIFA